jgi:anaerobic ribonucleoside-triphosphate reductase activating protein
MGGEWNQNELIQFLMLAKAMDYKTCLYTGQETVDKAILEQLNYIKTGPWIKTLGGLSSPNTNQRFRNLDTNKNLNHLFIKEMQ